MDMDHFDAAHAIAAECLCFRARRISRVLTRLYDEALRPLGIQSTQLSVLSAIAKGGEGGNLMARMAEGLAMDLTTLSRNLRPLEKAGLVRIERQPSDRRVRVALLTSEGERVLAGALPLWRTAHERVTQALGLDAAAELRGRLDTASAAAPRLLAAA